MACAALPELSYSEFGRHLNARLEGRRVPLMGSFELTFRCNLRCRHCYLDGQHDGVAGQAELSYDEIRGIFDQVADAGCLWFLLTGGEPLARPDFAEIYTYAVRKGFLVSLFTNGTLLTPRIADLIAEYKPFKVEITLYGYTQATYERITGIPGSHRRCMQGIELLLERGIRLNLKTMLMTLNRHELEDMEAYAARLGADFRFDPLLNAGVEGAHDPLAYRLSPEEIVQIEFARPQLMAVWHQMRERYSDHYPEPDALYNCGAGLTSFHIDPYGKLSLCLLARAPGYDLRAGTFGEGWDGPLRAERFRKRQAPSPCATCDLLPLCGQCPALAALEWSDAEQRVDFCCQLGHLRAQALQNIPIHLPLSDPLTEGGA